MWKFGGVALDCSTETCSFQSSTEWQQRGFECDPQRRGMPLKKKTCMADWKVWRGGLDQKHENLQLLSLYTCHCPCVWVHLHVYKWQCSQPLRQKGQRFSDSSTLCRTFSLAWWYFLLLSPRQQGRGQYSTELCHYSGQWLGVICHEHKENHFQEQSLQQLQQPPPPPPWMWTRGARSEIMPTETQASKGHLEKNYRGHTFSQTSAVFLEISFQDFSKKKVKIKIKVFKCDKCTKRDQWGQTTCRANLSRFSLTWPWGTDRVHPIWHFYVTSNLVI